MKTLTTLIPYRPSRTSICKTFSLKSTFYFFPAATAIKILRGWTSRLAPNSTPISQDFSCWDGAEVKSKFAFFQEQRERFAIDSVVFSQDTFCLIPKILNAVNVVLTVGKFLEWLMR